MSPASPIDSASSWLWWSNFVYVGGAVLTFVAAMLVFVEKRLIASGKRARAMIITEVFAIAAAILSFTGTCGAIYFGTVVSHLKDDDLAAYKASARVQIAQANDHAAQANAVARVANQKAADADKRSAEANVTAKTAVLDKTKILHDNLVLQSELDQEREARSPRHLGLSRQQKMLRLLAKVKPQSVTFVVYPGDPESEQLAREMAWVFQQIHWPFSFVEPLSGSMQGVRIEFDDKDHEAAEAEAVIYNAFVKASLHPAVIPTLPPIMTEIGSYTGNAHVGGNIRIFVGTK